MAPEPKDPEKTMREKLNVNSRPGKRIEFGYFVESCGKPECGYPHGHVMAYSIPHHHCLRVARTVTIGSWNLSNVDIDD